NPRRPTLSRHGLRRRRSCHQPTDHSAHQLASNVEQMILAAVESASEVSRRDNCPTSPKRQRTRRRDHAVALDLLSCCEVVSVDRKAEASHAEAKAGCLLPRIFDNET